MASLNEIVPAGVVTGDDLLNLFEHARANGYAIPAVNCTRCVVRRRFGVRIASHDLAIEWEQVWEVDYGYC